MARLAWDSTGERRYEIGVDRGVFYPRTGPAVPWNGLIAVREEPRVQESSVRYFNGKKYHNAAVADSFEGQIDAFTYPDGLEEDIFGLSYRTIAGTDDNPDGYKLHLVYNVRLEEASPEYGTISESSEALPFSWRFTTSPILIPGFRASAHLVIEATIAHSWVVEEIERVIYGDPFNAPRLPRPDEILEIFESGAILRVIDHGDGTWTATGPEEAIEMLNDHVFQITWPSAVFIDEDTWTISSL